MAELTSRLSIASTNPGESGPQLHTEERFAKFHQESLERKELSHQTIRNHFSTYTGFFLFLEPDQRTAPLGWGFGPNFETNLENYLAHFIERRYSSQYISDVRSRLQLWRASWVKYSRSAGLPEKFSEALKFLIGSSGQSPHHVARQIGLSFTGLSGWLSSKRIPRAKSIKYVRGLEEFFELPPDTLRGRLPKVLRGGRKENDPGLIRWREKQREIALERFHNPEYIPVALKDFPPEAEAEWSKVLHFFTDSHWCSVRKLKRNSTWRVREKDGRCVTGDIKRKWLADFFGFLVSPLDGTELKAQAEDEWTRKQYDLGELTIALLSDTQLVHAFIERKKRNRAVKAHNTYTRNYLHFAAQLVRPGTGFLWQQPEYAEKLPGDLSPEKWRLLCAQSHQTLTGQSKEFEKGKEYRQTRDSWEPLKAYVFHKQHPVDVLDDAVALMKDDFELLEGTELERAIFYRNLFLIEFLSVAPLRVWNFSIMEFRGDNTGHLYQLDGEQWWIRYDESEFKTEHTKEADQPYNIPLPQRIWATVDQYLFVHRPILIEHTWKACKRFREERGGGFTKAEEKKVINCPYVFRPHPLYLSHLSEAERLRHLPIERIPEQSLTSEVFRMTKDYVENCVGLNTHAFRKLVGSEIAKNHHQNYSLGAAVLHDRPETFRKSYQIAETSDFAATYNDYRDRRLQQREDERKGLAGRINKRREDGPK